MTIDKCAIACPGYKVFGIESGSECFCGDAIRSASVTTDDSECDFVCPGDSSEKCGGPNRLDVSYAIYDFSLS